MVKADEPWKEGPSLLDSADGVLLCFSGSTVDKQRAYSIGGVKTIREEGRSLRGDPLGNGHCGSEEY